MLLVQEPRLGGNSVGWSDKARKAIAKKQGKLFEECEKEYYENAQKKGCSSKLVDYVWQILLRSQKGYSFNKAHTLSYSIVGLQEMNLAYRFPVIYWNCANLMVDSGSTDVENEFDQEEEYDEDGNVIKIESKPVDYSKISTAISRMKNYGINITLPDINESTYGFSVDVDHNLIHYGIKGITRIGDALVQQIVQNRPYTSISDFMSKVKVNKTQIINLIKSGCFDVVEGGREEAMYDYLYSIADTKSNLTLQNMPMLIRESLIPEEMELYAKYFNFNKYLKNHKHDIYYLIDDEAYTFFSDHFDTMMLKSLSDGGLAIEQKDWDKIYKKAMEPMREYLKNPENRMLKKVNDHAFQQMLDKYAEGGVSKWEMDSVGFYYSRHELQEYYDSGYYLGYELSDFAELSEEPAIDYMVKNKKGQDIPIYHLNYIAGTVIGKNKTKHTVTLLANNSVVNVKIWDAQFTKYDKQISEKLSNGKKQIVERSWFSRGNKLLLLGIRRGENFIPKTYRNRKYADSPIMLITSKGLVTERYDET